MTKPEIYVSYAWRDRDKDPAPDDRETLVDEFCAACEKRGYMVQRDKSRVGYRDSIEAFMREIGAGRYVLAVISAKYLYSDACMFEAMRLLDHERFGERVFPIVFDDANIFDPEMALDYKIHWQDKLNEFSRKLDAIGRKSGTAEMQLKERDYKEIDERVLEFITRVTDANVLSPAVHLANGFSELFAVLETQIAREQAEATTPDHLPALTGEEPVFVRPDVKAYTFDHALRPAQTKSLVAKLPASLNLIGDKGQGRHRFMEDLESCGLAGQVTILRLKLSTYLSDYDAFLREIARLGRVTLTPGVDLVELLRLCALRQKKPVLLILENPDALYAAQSDLDRRFDIGFLQKLNALKNAGFVTLLLSSYRPVKDLTFRGQSSPLWLEVVSLNALSHDEISREVSRCLPELPDNLRAFIAEQLEFEPHHTHDLLYYLLESLASRSNPSRDVIGLELKALRQKFIRV